VVYEDTHIAAHLLLQRTVGRLQQDQLLLQLLQLLLMLHSVLLSQRCLVLLQLLKLLLQRLLQLLRFRLLRAGGGGGALPLLRMPLQLLLQLLLQRHMLRLQRRELALVFLLQLLQLLLQRRALALARAEALSRERCICPQALRCLSRCFCGLFRCAPLPL
jgi:hypothetical protein